MNSGIAQIAIHSVDFRNIGAMAFGAFIHIQLFVAAVFTVRQGQIDTLIKAFLHCPAHQSFNSITIVAHRIPAILDLATVEKIPEPPF